MADDHQSTPDQGSGNQQSSEWEFFIPLVEDSELDAVPCIPNRPGEVHSVDLTNYDRPDIPCVQGRLYHVIHGFLSSKNEKKKTRATLIVFEWEFHPQCPAGGHRFRQVDIKIAFEPDRDLRPETARTPKAHYAPQVLEMASRKMVKSLVRTRTAAPWAVGVKITLGFAPFVALECSIANSPDGNTETITDYRLASGVPMRGSPDSDHNDAVTWTVHENDSLSSGVQSPLRTAVLLEHQANGENGKFIVTIKTKATLSSFKAGMAEKIRRWTGLVPVDDPVNFDARVGPAAVVIGGRKDWLATRPCPCDVWNLGDEDLLKFLIKDED
jgi:hypothetical protein